MLVNGKKLFLVLLGLMCFTYLFFTAKHTTVGLQQIPFEGIIFAQSTQTPVYNANNNNNLQQNDVSNTKIVSNKSFLVRERQSKQYNVVSTSKSRRVAVLISGQLRTHNQKINPKYWGSTGSIIGAPAQMNINERVVDNQKRFFAQLGDQVDVFVLIQSQNTSVEPKVGDASACDHFKDTSTPQRWKVFCEIIKEKCSDPTVLANSKYRHALKRSEYSDETRLGVLCPYFGYRAVLKMMVKEERDLNMHYDWVVHLRPDVVFLHNWKLWEVVENSPPRLWMAQQGCPYARVPPCSGKCKGWPGGETTLTYCGMDVFNLGRREFMEKWMGMIDIATTRNAFVRQDTKISQFWGMEELPLTYGQELSGHETLNLPDFVVAVQRFAPGVRSYFGESYAHAGAP